MTPEQVDEYRSKGYVILRGLVDDGEVADMRADVERLVEEARRADGGDASVDHPDDFSFAEVDGVRVPDRLNRPLARSGAIRRTYANPALLAIPEALYGPDFVPSSESVVVKLPGNGAPFPWHQDGVFGTGEHTDRGVNVGIYLYPSHEGNGCVYALPGTQAGGRRIDIEQLIAEHGERLPGLVPVASEPGDVVVHDRNLVHGSFPNRSKDIRVTVYFGFHTRKVVEGFPVEQIRRREQVVGVTIAERAADSRYAGETPFRYQPLSGESVDPGDPDGVLRAQMIFL